MISRNKTDLTIQEKHVFEVVGLNCSLSLPCIGINLKVKFQFSGEKSNKSEIQPSPKNNLFLKKAYEIFGNSEVVLFC